MRNFDRCLLLPYLQDAFITELLCSVLANETELCKLKIHNSAKAGPLSVDCDPKLQLRTLQQRLSDAQRLRSQVYGFDLLPEHCRNIYGVYYLYHRFLSEKDTKLEEAVEEMDLRTIRGQLDQLILKEGRILLNRRLRTARQQKASAATYPDQGIVSDFLLTADYIGEL